MRTLKEVVIDLIFVLLGKMMVLEDSGKSYIFFHNAEIWVSAPLWVHKALSSRPIKEQYCNLCFDDYDEFIDVIEELELEVKLENKFAAKANHFGMSIHQVERLVALQNKQQQEAA